jgi:hypothetical protein
VVSLPFRCIRVVYTKLGTLLGLYNANCAHRLPSYVTQGTQTDEYLCHRMSDGSL